MHCTVFSLTRTASKECRPSVCQSSNAVFRESVYMTENVHLIGDVIAAGKSPLTVTLVPPNIGPLCGLNSLTTTVGADTGRTVIATSSSAKNILSFAES